MSFVRDYAFQGAQMLLVLLLSPLLTGFVRKVKARLLRRKGPPLLQPYRDLIRLMRKDVVLAESASWLFRVIPYIVFAGTWVAASLVPTFRGGLLFSWSADLIAIIALIGSARFFQALAGLDVGTSFGGIGSSREVMIASLAEPAMLMIVFTLALVAGSTQLSTIAAYMLSSAVGLRVSLGLALIALIMVAIAENTRIPIDNPATHLELTAACSRPGASPGPTPGRRQSPSALPPISPSWRPAACCWPCSRRPSPRCACSGCRPSSAPR
jgi:formate hydrogenlyase subunit 4